MERRHTLTAVLPCTDVRASQRFYERLGFTQATGDEQYLMLADAEGAEVHLQPVTPGWLKPKENPCGVYLYTEMVDEIASRFPGEILGGVKRPEDKPWGMYEFALSYPDEALVRIGWPTRLRRSSAQ